MALVVKLEKKWFLVDSGWGGPMFHGALELVSAKNYESTTGIYRPIAKFDGPKSTLDENLPLEWDLECKEITTIFEDFGNYEKIGRNDWHPMFRFKLKGLEIEDFSFQLHNLHVNEGEFCRANAFFCSTRKDEKLGHSVQVFVKGTECMTTHFLSPRLQKKSFKGLDINFLDINFFIKYKYEIIILLNVIRLFLLNFNNLISKTFLTIHGKLLLDLTLVNFTLSLKVSTFCPISNSGIRATPAGL